MTMLTKAFVVLVSILSVIVVSLFASYVATTQGVADELETMRASRDQAQAQARATGAELATAREQFNERLTELRGERRALEEEVERVTAELADAQSALVEERSRVAGFEASVARLSAAGTQQARLLERHSDELERRRSEAVDRQRDIIQLNDRVAELEAENRTHIREVGRVQREKFQLASRLEQFERRWDAVPESTRFQIVDAEEARPVADAPDHEIIGTVTDVQDVGEELLVQVDVGSQDGVVRHLPFMVSRGDQFVGRLWIEHVDATASVGRMILARQTVQPGDQIYIGPEFATRDLIP